MSKAVNQWAAKFRTRSQWRGSPLLFREFLFDDRMFVVTFDGWISQHLGRRLLIVLISAPDLSGFWRRYRRVLRGRGYNVIHRFRSESEFNELISRRSLKRYTSSSSSRIR